MRAFRDAGKPRCRCLRRRSKAPHGGGGPPIAVRPPSPTGIGAFRPASATCARVGCKTIQGKPRKKAWISLDSFGRIGTFQWVTANQIKKSAANSTRLWGCARTSVLNAIPPSLAPSDPLIVNWPPQKDIVYFSVFVNELDGGLKVGDPAQNEPRGQRSRSRLDPGGAEVGGSSSDQIRMSRVVARLATPVAAKRVARRTVRPGSRAGGSTFAESLRREVVVLTESLLKRVRRLTRR